MTTADRNRWNARYQDDRWQGKRDPLPLLTAHAPRPGGGKLALDVACGLGHNTLWLARQDYRALGLDGSRVALQRAHRAAQQQALTSRILFVEIDLDDVALPPLTFDLVLVARFLDRALLKILPGTLRPGGRLIYVTLNWRWRESHPDTDPAYLLAPGELRAAFSMLHIHHYDESADTTELVAIKPR